MAEGPRLSREPRAFLMAHCVPSPYLEIGVRGGQGMAHTVLDLAGVIYSAGKVFDGLEAGRHDVDTYLGAGSLEGVTSSHDRALLADLRDVAQHVLEVTRVAGAGFRVDAAFVTALNARIARSGALQPGRLRIEGQGIGVTTPLGRHEPPAVTAVELDCLLQAATDGRAPAEGAISLFIELAKAQPFMDGNKRVALFAANALLLAVGAGVLLTIPLDDHDPEVARAFNDALALAYVRGDPGPVSALLREQGLQK
jgi:hypothetical protein